MFLFRRIWFAAVSVAVSCLPFAVVAPPAAAELVDRSHENVSFTIEENVCGLNVTTTVEGVNNEQERLSRSGFPLFKSTGHGTVTYFNAETGKSVVLTFAGVTKDLTVVDNGDGTITVRWAVTGLAEAIVSSDGTVATRDVGRVVFATVLDYGGTPTDTSDDEFLSEGVESVSGPHPQLESGFTLFCQVLVAGLT
jgi:hypothetical protein